MKHFFEARPEQYYSFQWEKLGDISAGRRHLGENMPVLVYRMMEYSMRHVLYEEFGREKTDELFRKAGYVSGKEYALHNLPVKAESGVFMASFIRAMETLKVGLVRVEYEDLEKCEFVITVYEDLDCSGLPPTDEVVCNFDEGFLSGVLEVYCGKPVRVREIDCWASGDRVCRFRGCVEHGQK